MISLLSDFIKWADVLAIVHINNFNRINDIALRIAQVNGTKGFDVGQMIYPEIKGQKHAKKKFYVEFLKSV